eukprot:85643-Rhodomonas_salina.1
MNQGAEAKHKEGCLAWRRGRAGGMQGSKPKAEGGKKRSRNSAGQGGTLNAKRMKSEAKPIKCLSAEE